MENILLFKFNNTYYIYTNIYITYYIHTNVYITFFFLVIKTKKKKSLKEKVCIYLYFSRSVKE